MNEIIQKIKNETAIIAVLGLGYVGLPLSLTFAKKYKVIGYDINKEKIHSLNNGFSYIKDVGNDILKEYLNKTFFPTDDTEKIMKCDFFIICTPTPLTIEKEPDLSYIISACETIAKILKRGQFIILESTTYPGTTEEVLVPILEKTGLKAGKDFGVAFSPERVDPGNKNTIENIPKIVGGINQDCTNIAAELYGSVIHASIIKVKDCKTAEAEKIYENIFRNVNIALVNEFALICEKMEIDVWEVINAAATKPYGFMPFYPGPGIGGHCIPLDPYYMSYKAKKFGFIPRFIELSGEINDFMKVHTLNLAEYGLSKCGLKIRGSTIAVIGLAYKKDIDDVRESPTEKILEEIVLSNGTIKVYDPYVKYIKTKYGKYFSEKSMEDCLIGADCAIFVTDHTILRNKNLNEIVKLMKHPVVIDCKNIFKNEEKGNYIYLGIGKINKK